MPLLRHVVQSDGDVFDPAQQATVPSLRVLLGAGDARTLDAQSFLFNGRRYRGSFSRDPQTGAIVNTVSLQAYLYSVVPREMPHDWPAAALQAQAIAARTYVLERSAPLRSYDLVPSQADQVYTGIDAEHPESTAAVDATAGMVVRFESNYAQTVYSSCCGGHTEASHDAWDGPPIAYLCGVPCTYCAASHWYRWTRSVDDDRLATLPVFGQLGISAAALQRVELTSIDASGRAGSWMFIGPDASAPMRAAAIRARLGGRTLPSLRVSSVNVTPTQASTGIVIEGAGLGHGVGLCQWGARGMALAGADVRTILTFYYPGTTT